MTNQRIISNTIRIKASALTVWEVLTSPEQTKKYMFGCETVSDWKQGSALLWRGLLEGKEMVFVKGTIVEINPPHRLVYTVFDPNASMPDLPENYLRVTYDLLEQAGTTVLTVTQGDFATVADGEKRYADAYNKGEGWNPVLVQIRQVAEEASSR